MILDDLDDLPEIFKNSHRGIMLLHRNKDGETGNAQRKSIKKISRDIEEWYKIVCEFKELQQNTYEGYRIYSSVNSRNMEKAIHEFKLRSLHADYDSLTEKEWFYVDIQNRFFSCLMNPNCREQSNLLIDCDSNDECKLVFENIPQQLILFNYKTKNGMHFLTKPFNPKQLHIPIHIIKKDAMIYVG
jgi:hypothetical protein